MKRKSRTKTALDLWKKYVKQRDGYTCRRCGKSRPDVQIQAHHVISSTNWRLRFDPLNGVCVCAGCHMGFFHGNDPFDWPIVEDWYKKNVDWDYLQANRTGKVNNDYDAIINSFKQALEGKK